MAVKKKWNVLSRLASFFTTRCHHVPSAAAIRARTQQAWESSLEKKQSSCETANAGELGTPSVSRHDGKRGSEEQRGATGIKPIAIFLSSYSSIDSAVVHTAIIPIILPAGPGCYLYELVARTHWRSSEL